MKGKNMKINNRIKSIKDVEIETPTICYSCGWK